MKTVDVYFDYACPFCYTGLRDLHAVLPEFPDLQVAYHACEAWPDPNSEAALAFQGMHCILAHHGDVRPYHDRVFAALFDRKQHLDVALLAQCAEASGIDVEVFSAALIAKTYAEQQTAANNHAYDTLGIEAVPTLFCGALRYDAELGVGITPEGLRRFFTSCNRR